MADSGYRVTADQAALRKLVADLKTLEDGKKQVTALRRTLKTAAGPMAEQVKSNASWSKRIPGAVGVQVRFTAKVVGASIFVSRTKAPHARPLENSGNSGTFQHPVFGKGETRQTARPFFFNQLATHMSEVERAVVEAIDEATKGAGF